MNTGVIIDVRETDFQAAGETGIPYEVRLQDGDWESWRSSDERQSRPGIYDSLSCVTFSGMNSVEAQLNWLLLTGQIPKAIEERCRQIGYIDESGRFNFNDWFTANMSGTTTAGNTLQAIWDSIRKDGLLPQKSGYQVGDFKTTEEWLDRSKVTQAMKDEAKQILEMFMFRYEWVVLAEQGAWDKYAKHVKQAPLHIATPTCGSWNSPEGTIVLPCAGVTRLNHATCYIGQVPSQYHKDMDHYPPFIKKLAWDYYMPFALKGLVELKVPPQVQPPAQTEELTEDVQFGMEGPAVKKLQAALQTINAHSTGKPYMKPGVFGPYGPQTRTAVDLLQREHGVEDPERGENAGPQTRAVINIILQGIKK